MGAADRLEAEGLRSLHADKIVTRDRFAKGAVRLRQRVDDGQGRNGAVARFERRQQAVDHRGGKEGAGGVVDQDAFDIALPRQRFEAVRDRLPPRRAAKDRSGQGAVAHRLGIGLFLPAADHDLDGVDARMTKMVDGVGKKGLARDAAILLGHPAAGAAAAAGRDDQCHCPSHARCLAEAKLARQRIPPYLARPMARLAPIQIGPVRIEAPVILAPMTGVTDMPFRRIVKRYGAGLTVTEMIASQAAIRETRQSLQKTVWDPIEEPVSMQLAGCSPPRWPRRRSSTRSAAPRSSTSTWAARSRRWSMARPARR